MTPSQRRRKTRRRMTMTELVGMSLYGHPPTARLLIVIKVSLSSYIVATPQQSDLVEYAIQWSLRSSDLMRRYLILPTHVAHFCTSSLVFSFSTVYHCCASSSFGAQLCTNLWHGPHSQATEFSIHSSCHPLLRTFSWVERGIRW